MNPNTSSIPVIFRRFLIWLGILFAGNICVANEQFLTSIKPGEWREIPKTALREVFPSQSNHPGWGTIGPRGVVAAWSGAAFDTKRNVLIITGGGHTD